MSGEDLISKIKKNVRDTFETISAEFDETRYKPWPETVDFLKTLPAGSRLLDLGCGNGRNAVFAAQNGFCVTGVDVSMNMLSIARSKYNKLAERKSSGVAHFVQSDLESLPLDDNSIDAAICVATIHHIPSVEARLSAVTELWRVLKADGRAFISVWDLDQPRFKAELMRQVYGVCMAQPRNGGEIVGSCGDPAHPPPYEFGDVWVPWQAKSGKTHYRFYHLFYHTELVELIDKAGFKLLKYFRRMDNHNAIVIKGD